MNMPKYKLNGWRPTPTDERNYKLPNLCSTNVTLDKTKRLVPKDKVNIIAQPYNDCVGEALAYHAFESNFARTGSLEPFSPGWTYGNRSETDSHNPGMEPTQAIKHYMDDGIVLLKDFPENAEMPDIMNKVLSVRESLLPKARQHKLKAWAEIYSVEEIKIAITQLGTPVFAGIPITQSFFSAQKNGIVSNPDFNKESIIGYHGIIIDGWNETYLENPGSWGREYGDNGWNYFPLDYPFVQAFALTFEDAITVPVSKTLYRVQTNAYEDRMGAVREQNFILNKLKLGTSLQYEKGLFKVQCGAFEDYGRAVVRRDLLRVNGYPKAWIKPCVKTM